MSRSTSPARAKNWLFFVSVIALCDASVQTRAITRDSGAPVFGLYLPSILQHSHVDIQVLGRFNAPREIDIGPLALVRGEQALILTDVLLLFRAERVGRIAIGLAGAVRSSTARGIKGLAQDIAAVPTHLFELV